LEPEEMIKYIEKEVLRIKALYGFHFMDDLIDKIIKYSLENDKISVK
jgi:hypothetical protein